MILKMLFCDQNDSIKAITDLVHKYRYAQDCVGELLLKYDDIEQMNYIIEHMDDYVHIKVDA